VSRPGFWKVLAATTFAVWGIAATAEATPVTYEFADLLNAAINGSTVVFGHFTLDAAAASITTFSFTTPTGLPTDPE